MLGTVKNSIEEFNEMLARAESLGKDIFGSSKNELNLFLQESIRFRRLQNQVEVFEKVKELMSDNNISPKQVNLKTLFPLIEGIGLEEDPELQTMWSNLLVNYVDSSATSINIVYPHILKSLSTNEVKFLKWLTDHDSGINTAIKNPEIEFEMHEVHNLERLSLIEGEILYFTQPNFGPKEINWQKTDNYFLTKFGKDFLKACHRNPLTKI